MNKITLFFAFIIFSSIFTPLVYASSFERVPIGGVLKQLQVYSKAIAVFQLTEELGDTVIVFEKVEDIYQEAPSILTLPTKSMNGFFADAGRYDLGNVSLNKKYILCIAKEKYAHQFPKSLFPQGMLVQIFQMGTAIINYHPCIRDLMKDVLLNQQNITEQSIIDLLKIRTELTTKTELFWTVLINHKRKVLHTLTDSTWTLVQQVLEDSTASSSTRKYLLNWRLKKIGQRYHTYNNDMKWLLDRIHHITSHEVKPLLYYKKQPLFKTCIFIMAASNKPEELPYLAQFLMLDDFVVVKEALNALLHIDAKATPLFLQQIIAKQVPYKDERIPQLFEDYLQHPAKYEEKASLYLPKIK